MENWSWLVICGLQIRHNLRTLRTAITILLARYGSMKSNQVANASCHEVHNRHSEAYSGMNDILRPESEGI